MLDPEHDFLPPSSPTISSVSSSDLDTESTGSFFHDRSTSLGTLMGVSYPAITARVPSQRDNNVGAAIVDGGGGGGSGGGGGKSKNVKKSKKKKAVGATAAAAERRRGRWWRLCRDDSARPASLGDFLEVERRFGDGAFFGEAAELENVVLPLASQGNGRLLFADGRVLPPSQAEAQPPTAGPLCRLPVLLTGICSGGGG
ncbi:uncharacterized protein At3g17950-like [Macadamia integrifolia]|uniref:uncharacterized protein At3g17950-like n=1 Tax=Macadamia integrifolia TaxID=60698 RepID=UPI001C4FE88B|nr:uncharacterized protein At3g17950-like [Macadamia integrifolia]